MSLAVINLFSEKRLPPHLYLVKRIAEVVCLKLSAKASAKIDTNRPLYCDFFSVDEKGEAWSISTDEWDEIVGADTRKAIKLVVQSDALNNNWVMIVHAEDLQSGWHTKHAAEGIGNMILDAINDPAHLEKDQETQGKWHDDEDIKKMVVE